MTTFTLQCKKWWNERRRLKGRVEVVRDDRVVFVHTFRLDDAKDREQFAQRAVQYLDDTGATITDILGRLAELYRQANEQPEEHSFSTSTEPGVEDAAWPYRETERGIVMVKIVEDDEVETLLANFTARIEAEIAEDDGSGDVRRVFRIVSILHGRERRFDVPAATFNTLHWVVEHLGAGAIIEPGFANKDQLRAAIQKLSGEVEEYVVFTHTGWRQVAEKWIYLHAGGAIGSNGPVAGITVALAPPLDRYELPRPPEGPDLVLAVRASLRLTTVAPSRLTAPLAGATWRAALPGVDFSVYLVGFTGTGKSELAARFQQHCGAGMDARHLPASWSSTGNALEGLAFVVKNALFTIDDFVPAGTATDIARQHREADRILRAQGNVSGRQRMRADISLRPAHPPRGLVLGTGEDTPRGQSLRSRMLVLEVGRDDVNWDVLGACQVDGAAGRYAQAMAAFIQWAARHYGEITARLPVWEGEVRQLAHTSAAHRRVADIIAKLAAGWALVMRFAVAVDAVTRAEADEFLRQAWLALGGAATEQQQQQQAADPVRRALALLRGALVGGMAHVATVDEGEPLEPAAWGWQRRQLGEDDDVFERRGSCIGWLDGNDLYLEPEVSYSLVQQMAARQAEAFALSARTWHRRLGERGLLRSTEPERLTVRKVCAGRRQYVLHLAADVFGAIGVDQSNHERPDDYEPGPATGTIGTIPWFDLPDDPPGPDPDSGGSSGETTLELGDTNANGSNGPMHETEGHPTACDARHGSDSPLPIPDHEYSSPRGTQHADAEATDLPEEPGSTRDSASAEIYGAVKLPTVVVVTDAAELQALLPGLCAAQRLGYDGETTGLDPHSARLRLIQFALPNKVIVVDCFTVPAGLLAPLFAAGPALIGHNLAFDLRFAMAAGLPIPNGDRLVDTMLLAQLLDAGRPAEKGRHSLAGVAQRFLGATMDKREQVSDWSGDLSPEQVTYAAVDAVVLLPLADALSEAVKAARLERAASIEHRALLAIAAMAYAGVPFDGSRWAELSDTAVAAQLRLGDELTAAAGKAVNWASPAQVKRILRARGHDIENADERTLKDLADREPLAPILLEYREASRRASTYGIEVLNQANPATGRLHGDFHQLGAASGRMSCRKPSLLNLPRDPAYRGCICPAPGRAIVKADYSQIELRIAAQLAPDPVMRRAFQDGVDLHTHTAAAVLDKVADTVTKQDRQLAKAINFGLLYGMGAAGLQAYAGSNFGVNITLEEATQFRSRFFGEYQGLRRWHRHQPRETVSTRTLVGRRRLGVAKFTEKLNSPVQGTGADILKLALARLWEDRAAQPTALLVLCVHDEIVLECEAVDAQAAADWLRRHMEQAGQELLPDVPIVVETTVAANWAGTPL